MRKILYISSIFGIFKKNVAAAAKKKPCQALNGWIKSIINHLWWDVSTCDGDEKLLR